jgi:hypothetical protein
MTWVAQRHENEVNPEDFRGYVDVEGGFRPKKSISNYSARRTGQKERNIATAKWAREAVWFRPNGPSRLSGFDPIEGFLGLRRQLDGLMCTLMYVMLLQGFGPFFEAIVPPSHLQMSLRQCIAGQERTEIAIALIGYGGITQSRWDLDSSCL